jgi:hypothetical protein
LEKDKVAGDKRGETLRFGKGSFFGEKNKTYLILPLAARRVHVCILSSFLSSFLLSFFLSFFSFPGKFHFPEET